MSKPATKKPKICITAPLIYPLFQKGVDTPFGGIEVRMAVIARELAHRNNFDVNIVVGDFGQPHIEKIDNITFYSWRGRTLWGVQKSFGKDGLQIIEPINDPGAKIRDRVRILRPYLGRLWELLRRINRIVLRGINFSKRILGYLKRKIEQLIEILKRQDPLYTRLAGYAITRRMISIYDEVNADIYLVPGNSQYTAEVAFYCKKRQKKFVFIGASEMDFYPEYKKKNGADIYGVPYEMKTYSIVNAHGHIVQNPSQQVMLKDGYGINSTVIKTPIDVTPWFPVPKKRCNILWVGKSDEQVKQPSIVFKLARELPEYLFTIVMNKAIEKVYQQCLLEASKLANVTLIEKVPFEEIERFFAEARLHVNTSSFEGFPNTFLQAAKYGIPTVSLQVDPAGMLSEHHCGLVAGGDYPTFKEQVRTLMSNHDVYSLYYDTSRKYIHDHHNKNIIATEFERVLLTFLKS